MVTNEGAKQQGSNPTMVTPNGKLEVLNKNTPTWTMTKTFNVFLNFVYYT